MQEQLKLQEIPVKVYKTDDRLMVVAPMPGLEPENIMIEVTDNGHLILNGELRGILKDVKEYLYLAISCGENQHGINFCRGKIGKTEARSI
jgi:HSP20 family molecular chaperone IbpA